MTAAKELDAVARAAIHRPGAPGKREHHLKAAVEADGYPGLGVRRMGFLERAEGEDLAGDALHGR